jgi:hypothetical protein
MTPKQKIIEDYIDLLPLSNNVYQICEKAVKISDEFAIRFAKFYYVMKIGETKDTYKSTEELLEIYKEL